MNGFTHTKATTSSQLGDEQKRTSELRISWFETLTMRGGYYVFCVNLLWKEMKEENRKVQVKMSCGFIIMKLDAVSSVYSHMMCSMDVMK